MVAAKRKKGRRPVEVSDEDYKPIPTFGRPFVASERDSLEEEALEEQQEEEEEEQEEEEDVSVLREDARGAARAAAAAETTANANAAAEADAAAEMNAAAEAAAAEAVPPSRASASPTGTPPPKKRGKTSCGSTTAASCLENFFRQKLAKLSGTGTGTRSDADEDLVAFALRLLESELVANEAYKEIVVKYETALDAAMICIERLGDRMSTLRNELLSCREKAYTAVEARAMFGAVDDDAVRRAVSDLEATKKGGGCARRKDAPRVTGGGEERGVDQAKPKMRRVWVAGASVISAAASRSTSAISRIRWFPRR